MFAGFKQSSLLLQSGEKGFQDWAEDNDNVVLSDLTWCSVDIMAPRHLEDWHSAESTSVGLGSTELHLPRWC